MTFVFCIPSVEDEFTGCDDDGADDHVLTPHEICGQLDSMEVACADDEDRTWIHQMQVNNDAIIYADIEEADDVNAEEEQITYEEALADDLCMASMMAKSIMQNCHQDVEVFGRECAENGPRVGLIFESKQKLVEQLCEWANKCSVSFQVLKSCANQYTVHCDVEETCPWRVHASLSVRKNSD